MTVADLVRFVEGTAQEREGAFAYLAGLRDGIGGQTIVKQLNSVDLDCVSALTPQEIYGLIEANKAELTGETLVLLFLTMRINDVCAIEE